MNLNNRDFFITVNLAMFRLEQTERRNVKRLPEKELMVLLMKRGREPYKKSWQFPYGFVNIDESLDDAVYRELKEKTNLENIYFEQLYTWGALDRDPTARVIATSYFALVQNENIKVQAIEERGEFKWFSVRKYLVTVDKITDEHVISKYLLILYDRCDDIKISYYVYEDKSASGFEKRIKYRYEPESGSDKCMAYDHIKILDYALDRIKNKVLYTNIAFGLISPQFTLTELQQVYEVLLGRELIKPNFRKWISHKVEETHETKRDGAYRPSKLYKLKKSSILSEDSGDFYTN